MGTVGCPGGSSPDITPLPPGSTARGSKQAVIFGFLRRVRIWEPPLPDVLTVARVGSQDSGGTTSYTLHSPGTPPDPTALRAY